jgi:hypothetical protein
VVDRVVLGTVSVQASGFPLQIVFLPMLGSRLLPLWLSGPTLEVAEARVTEPLNS